MKLLVAPYFAVTLITAILFPLQAFSDTAEDNYKSAEHLLDGVNFEYFYQTGGGLKIDFADGLLGYEWIKGSRKGNKASGIPYQSRKIGDSLYLVNWQEKEKPDFVTLVIDLEQNVMYSSAILRYGTDQEVIHFNGAIIERAQNSQK